jgi:tetratricopeptide (TPR) repeat protein
MHQAGDLPQAEQAYRQLLEQERGNAQGWYLLGVLCAARGELADAAVHLDEAIRLRPGFVEALHHRGLVFIKQQRFTEAVASLREALWIKPNDADVQTNLGIVLAHQGQYAEALCLFQAVLQKHPDDRRVQSLLRAVQAQQTAAGPAATAPLAASLRPTGAATAENEKGLICLHQGMLSEAEGCFRQALRLHYAFPDVHYHLGYTLSCQGKLEEASASYREAVRLRPDFAEAHSNLGLTLLNLKRAPEAEASCRQAVRLRPESAEVHINLGVVLLSLARLDDAFESLQRAVQLKPGCAQAHNHLGRALQRLGRLEEAATRLREAVRLHPNHAEAITNLGHVLAGLGQSEEALACFGHALRLQPDYAEAHWYTALVRLRQGDFERGLADYEWRWRLRDFGSTPPSSFAPKRRWNGSQLAGRTILLYAEQGLGDTIQFIRYARLLKALEGTVIVALQRPLLRLLARCPGIDQLVAEGDPLPPHDVHAPLLSVPYHLRTRLDTIPAGVPYLWADPMLVERWRHALAGLPGFKIGIAWQGNRQFSGDLQRSISLLEFAPLAAVPGVQLVSLQRGSGSDQLWTVAEQWPVTDLGRRLDEEAGPFMDTAAVMKNLDLVVTSDTSIPHLAGALGVPVWVALAKVPDWRFLLEREDSPWYPTMRLFRQEKRGEWGPVFQRIAQAVRQRMAR